MVSIWVDYNIIATFSPSLSSLQSRSHNQPSDVLQIPSSPSPLIVLHTYVKYMNPLFDGSRFLIVP